MNYYNEFDPSAIAWLRELIKAGAIPDGHIDTRSIADVQPEDLDGFDQCHFFAGIGGWSEALRIAGYAGMRGLWTGSCPCQPFSAAGKRKGTADARHLWPEMFRLVKACRPQYVLGEQVEAAIRLGWLDGVFGDLEGEGYTCGAAVLGAHSVGAPHIRQRLYWGAGRVGNPIVGTRERGAGGVSGAEAEIRREDGVQYGDMPVGFEHAGEIVSSGLEHAPSNRRNERRPEPSGRGATVRCGEGADDGLADATSGGLPGRTGTTGADGAEARDGCGLGDPNGARLAQQQCVGGISQCQVGTATGKTPWGASTSIMCADGKTRRISVEPALFPLAHGVPGRVGLLRGAGNAIVPQVAALFITSFMESLEC